MGRRPSYKNRLVVGFVAMSLFAVVFTGLAAVGIFRLDSSRELRAELARQAETVAMEAAGKTPRSGRPPRPDPGRPKAPENVPVGSVRSAGRLDLVSIWIRLPSEGLVELKTDGIRDVDPEFVSGIRFGVDGTGRGTIEAAGGRAAMTYAAKRVSLGSGAGEVIAVVGKRAGPGATISGTRRFALAAALAVGVSILVALGLGRRLSSPLSEMTAAADAIASGDMSRRVALPREREMAELAASFNEMAEEIAASATRERELLMNVSHDLRTPLTSIRGYAEALADGTISGEGEVSRAANVIGEEASRLERLVDDLLYIARVRSGEIPLRSERVDVFALIEKVAAAKKPLADDGGIRMVLEAVERPSLVTDSDRLVRLLGNLLDNAIEHTPSGGTVKLIVKRGANGDVVIEVSDTGKGIEPSELPLIFERLYSGRVDTKGRKGTGLGLAIVKQIAENLGGAIEVESVEDEGSTFRVELPAAEWEELD